jgi:hypothetical protein
VVEVELEAAYDPWEELARDQERYQAEKSAIAEAVIGALDERFPELANAVEVVDVATPMTWVWHTANWRGAFEGWLPTRGAMAGMVRGTPSTLPGLGHFFMVGQWVGMGGLPSVAPAGRDLVKQLCKLDKKPFVTTVATHAPAHLMPDFGSAALLGQPPRTPVEGGESEAA